MSRLWLETRGGCYYTLTTNKKVILEFLRKNTLATISTVNPNTLQPESALIAFAELENLEIIFLTLVGSRKYENLAQNNKVALVIGFDRDEWETLQYEGFTKLIPKLEEKKYRSVFLKKKNSPCTEEFFDKPNMKLFKITPTWIGFSKFPKNKRAQVMEMKEFYR